jgi:hypothetical protein
VEIWSAAGKHADGSTTTTTTWDGGAAAGGTTQVINDDGHGHVTTETSGPKGHTVRHVDPGRDGGQSFTELAETPDGTHSESHGSYNASGRGKVNGRMMV